MPEALRDVKTAPGSGRGLGIGCDVVAGASSGLGAALATHLCCRERRLVLVARRGDRLREIADASLGEQVCVTTDLRVPEQTARLVEVIRQNGVVGTLFLVAGAVEPRISTQDVVDHQREVADYLRLLFTGWVSLVECLESDGCLGPDSIVVGVSSIAAGVPFGALPLYGAGKAALEQWMRAKRRCGAPRYVVVRPGRFESEFFGASEVRPELPMGLAREIIRRVEAGEVEIHLGGRADRMASAAQRCAGRLGRFIVRDASPVRSDS